MKRSILKAALSIALITSVGFSSELTLCGSKVEFSKKLSLNKIASYSTQHDDILIVVHTKDGLSSAQKDKLYLSGVKAIKYAGINSFYFLLNANSIEQIIEKFKFLDGFSIVNEKHKINEELKGINSSEEINIIVSLIQDNITKSEFKSMLDSAGVDYKNLRVNSDFNEARFSIYGIDLESVAKLAVVKEIRKEHKIDVIKPFSVKLETKDVEVAEETNVDDVWNNNTELDGLTIPVAIVDEGKVRKSHREFMLGKATRVRDYASGSLSLHSTHVSGIIGAKGINTQAKGMANATQIYSFRFTSDFYFAKAVNYINNNFGILVSNHSYGFTDAVDLGKYNSDAASLDNLVSANPYLNIFIAAGNDRGVSGYPDTGIIKGAANAKNVITVGALTNDASNVAYFSSVGPVYDGRIKPDISVRGSSVYSTANDSDDDYYLMSGTSMATPGATGIATLIMQEYKKVTNCNNRGCDMRADVLKAVLINTAIDKNSVGPDIYTGYGMINAQKAVEAVESLEYSNNKHMIKLDSISKNATKTYNFTLSSKRSFKVTISWIDPAGNSASSGNSLVNDIDMYIEDNNGKKYYPYTLNYSNIKANAIKQPNHKDNSEKIEIDELPAGDYKLVVNGENIQTGSQEYALVASEAIFDKSSVNDTPKVEFQVNNFVKIMLDSIY